MGSTPTSATTEILPESRREPRDMAVLIVVLAVGSRERPATLRVGETGTHPALTRIGTGSTPVLSAKAKARMVRCSKERAADAGQI